MDSQELSADTTGDDRKASSAVYSGPITLPVVTDHSNFQISKSNKLIEGQTNLSTRQLKVLGACISLIDPRASYPNGITVELSDDQIESLTGIPKRTIPRFIDEAAKAFHSIPIETPGKKQGTTDYINIAHRSRYDPDERVFRMTFHSEMEDELLNLPEYTRYALRYLIALTSKYSIRLFELISKSYDQKRGGVQYWKAKLNDLYYPLGLVDVHGNPIAESYVKKVGLFRQRVLTPAIEEINQKTIFEIEAAPFKRGKFYAGFTFKVSRSQPIEVLGADVSGSDIELRLLSLGVLGKVAKRWVKDYDEDVLTDNLNYMGTLRDGGMDVKNPSAFLNTLLQNNVAQLPPVVNPYNKKYTSTKYVREFIKQVGMKVWWYLNPELQQSIVDLGGFTSHPVSLDDYRLFEATAKDSSIDEASMLFDPQSTADEWNTAFASGGTNNNNLF